MSGLLNRLNELTAPSLSEVAAPHLSRIVQILDETDDRCPVGSHNQDGHCVPLNQLKAHAHAIGQGAHQTNKPEHHLAAARAYRKAAQAHRAQGFHKDAHDLNNAAKDHLTMTRHTRATDTSVPCPPGQVRSAHGHCASPNDVSTHAHGLSKIADFHSKHASMHGGADNHQSARNSHEQAAKAHAHAAKVLGPAGRTDPTIFKLAKDHGAKAAEHSAKARNHTSSAMKAATGG